MIKGKEARCLSSSGENLVAFRTWMYSGNVSQLKAGMPTAGVLAAGVILLSVGLELDWAKREAGMANRAKIEKAILGNFIRAATQILKRSLTSLAIKLGLVGV